MKKSLSLLLALLPLYSFAQFIVVTPYAGATFCRPTKNTVLLNEAKKVWHPMGGIDAYIQSSKGYEIGAGYCAGGMSLKRMSATYNLGNPMHNVYVILGTGYINKDIILGLQAQFGMSFSKRDAGAERVDVANYAADGTNIALKITVGKRLGKNYCLSIQPAIRSYNLVLEGVKIAGANKFYSFEGTLALQRLFARKK